MATDGWRRHHGTDGHRSGRLIGGFVFARWDAPVKPLLQALLLADHVYEDKATGKKVVAGIFNRVHARRTQPSTMPANPDEPKAKRILDGTLAGSPYAYISITEVYKSIALEMRYVDLQDNSILLTAEIKIDVENVNPLDTIELTVPVPVPLPIPHSGTFALELLYEGEVLGSHRVTAVIQAQKE